MLFGYKSCTDYYQDASPGYKLPQMAVPILCLNAADDPFSPKHGETHKPMIITCLCESCVLNSFLRLLYDFLSLSIAFPVSLAQRLPNVALLVTSHGGHIGFLEGLFPHGEGYMDRVFSQFIRAAFEHQEDLKEACSSSGSSD